MDSDHIVLQKYLLSLIKTHHNEEVKWTLENAYTQHSLDIFGTALLHYATKHGNGDVISYLCSKGRDPDAQNTKGETALVKALMKVKRTKALRALLDAGADPLKLNHENKSALQMLCSNHEICTELHSIFLQKFRQTCFSSEEAAKKLIDAGCHLYRAVYTGDPKVLEYMLQHGFSANFTILSTKITALHIAAGLAELDSAKVLLKYGADVDALDFQGRNPLSHVWYEGTKHSAENVEILRLLLSQGASPTTCYCFGNFQSMSALMKGDSRAVGALLSHWDFTARDESNNEDVLHYLADNCNPGVVDELKFHSDKCNVNALDKNMLSPLHAAANAGNPRMVEFLLDLGVDVDHSAPGYTALYAVFMTRRVSIERQRECLEMLLQRGADPQNSVTYDPRVTIFDVALNQYGRRSCKRLEPVIAKLAMMEELGTTIEEVIRRKIGSRSEWQIYYDRCRRVLRKEIHENVTLLELMSGSERILSKYAGKVDLLVKLKRIGNKHKVRSLFSYYRNALTKRILEVIEFRRLRSAAAGRICRIFGDCIDETHLVTNRVSDYLSGQDFGQLCQL